MPLGTGKDGQGEGAGHGRTASADSEGPRKARNLFRKEAAVTAHAAVPRAVTSRGTPQGQRRRKRDGEKDEAKLSRWG